jgi:hypothetical protein
MSDIFVCGLGAVSPAGWGVAALREAMAASEPLPIQGLDRRGGQPPLPIRQPPSPIPRPAFFSHPRLRRASPLSQYVVGAGLEACAAIREKKAEARIGVLLCLQSGPVQYACRFFEETLRDPATASPMLFPETVFAAPASHLAALLGNPPIAYTLVSDPSGFLAGTALAAEWLRHDRVDFCVVAGGEEFNWLHAEAVWLFDHRAIITSGAGAICLTPDPAFSIGARLDRITDAHTYTGTRAQAKAAAAMRAQLPPDESTELLCDGLGTASRPGAAEDTAWRSWPGTRLSPKRVLGEGLMASAAWQCVLAADAVASHRTPAANVSLVGCNQQAIGGRFVAAG